MIFCYHRNNFTIIEVQGTDCAKFLQGQFTADIVNLAENRASFCAYCDIKGRVLADFMIFKRAPDCYWLWLPSNVAEQFCQTLDKFGFFSKISTKIIEDYDIVGCYGAEPELLAEVFGQAWPQDKFAIAAHDQSYLFNLDPEAKAVEIICPKAETQANLDRLLNLDISDLPAEYADVLLSLPWIDSASSCQHLPHSLNLPQLKAVSFSKGCYLGQEIIARMEFKGKPKRGLYQIKLPTTDAQPGTTIPNPDNAKQIIGVVLLSYPITAEESVCLVSMNHP